VGASINRVNSLYNVLLGPLTSSIKCKKGSFTGSLELNVIYSDPSAKVFVEKFIFDKIFFQVGAFRML